MEKFQNGKQVKVLSNYYKVKLGSPIFKYKVEIIPPIPTNQLFLFNSIIRTIRKELEIKLKAMMPFNLSIYSPYQMEDADFNTTYENIEYTVNIRNTGILDFSQGGEAQNILGRLVKLAQLSLKMKPVGRKYFNDQKAIPFREYKIKVWPGCSTTVKMYKGTCMLNLDLGYKVLKEQTMLDYLEEIKRQYKGNMERISEDLVGMTVITVVEELDSNLSPQCSFVNDLGEKTRFDEYYEKRYNKRLSRQEQPLLVVTRKGKKIHLIPELCLVTGLTERERGNFNLMKDLSTVTKKNPQQRVEASKEFLDMFQKESAGRIIKEWAFEIDKNTVELNGKKIPSGRLVMYGNENLEVENNRNLEREAQRKLLSEVELGRVGVFCLRSDGDVAESFLNFLADAARTYKYPIRQPKLFTISGIEWDNWRRTFRDKLDDSVQFVILILPGRRKNSILYDDCKRFFISEMPIPSQVVLADTLKGKNVRSIVNKILVQVATKAGATPWSIEALPFTNQPTMLVGMHIQQKGSKTIIAVSGSVNRNFSKYWSAVEVLDHQLDKANAITKIFKRAIIEFSTYSNNPPPTTVIVYREGASEGQNRILKDVEARAIIKAIQEAANGTKSLPEVFFVVANKKTGAKFYDGNVRNLENPTMGTVIDETITAGKDFYLVSQIARQGTASPTHFQVIIYAGANEKREYTEKEESSLQAKLAELEALTYKMCYLYYNWLGSIRLPAPLKYAEVLGSLMVKLEKQGNFFLPHNDFSKYKSLFYI